MAIKEWITHLPAGPDTPAVDQEDLVDNVDTERVSQIHTVRDIAGYCAVQIGSDLEEGGSLRKRVTDLEGSSGTDEKVKVSATDTTPAVLDSKLVVANGLTKTVLTPSGNETLQLSPTYGSAANTVCQGNDSRLSDNRTDANAIHKTTASEIHGITNKASPIGADELVIEDSADSWNKKRIAISTLPSGGLDTTAIHKATAAEISAMTAKGTPVSADVLVIEDSADSYNKKKITIGTLPAGGSFSGREEEFTATGGDQNLVLAAVPATNANMLSGKSIIGVFRNGLRLRYQASPVTSLEFGFTSTQTINCKALTAGDIITVVYSS